MNFRKNFNLKDFNTFKINAKTNFFIKINTLKSLKFIFQCKKFKYLPKFILGNGSNTLFVKDFNGLIIKLNLKGKFIIKEYSYHVIIASFAGESWTNFVIWTVNQGFSGLENLSLIPGTVGAAPIQNIGAYGVEIKDILIGLYAYEIKTGKIVFFSKKECELNYRNSIFKNKLKNKYVILFIYFFLRKKKKKFNLLYKEVIEELEKMKIIKPTLKNITKAIINIRKNKIPNPIKIGNCGSFFKNPIINNNYYNFLKEKYPNISGNFFSKNLVKLSAGWLIEKSGWKGKRIGNVGIYNKSSNIIVNYGTTNGIDIYTFSKRIIDDVNKKFGIILDREVIIV
ncbi:MAG: UDP-N-acetylmuramate dehydrogenase [Candidatus Bostrichicola ureolyticus]|nr:MAG: UDP-N-acetylmuramate dehydrogenase [Candidatus Bostrichicola ureolyticus]